MVVGEIVEWAIELIQSLGGLGVFIGVLLESIIAPIPSPIIIMAASFILIPAGIALPEALARIFMDVAIPGAIGSTVGAFIGFSIGYFGGRPIIDRYSWFLGVTWKEVKEFEKKFERRHRDALTLFLSRAIPIIPLSVVSAVSGVLRIKVKAFTIWTFFGSLARCMLLGIIGWLMGSAYASVAQNVDLIESLVTWTILLSGLFLIYLFRRRRKRG